MSKVEDIHDAIASIEEYIHYGQVSDHERIDRIHKAIKTIKEEMKWLDDTYSYPVKVVEQISIKEYSLSGETLVPYLFKYYLLENKIEKTDNTHHRPFITHLEDKSEKLYYEKKGDTVYLTIIEDNVNEEKKTTYGIPKYCHLYLNPEFKAYIDDLFKKQ